MSKNFDVIVFIIIISMLSSLLLIIFPGSVAYFVSQQGKILWKEPMIWVALLLMIAWGCFLIAIIKTNALKCKISDVGVTITYFGKIYKTVKWDEIISAKIINVRGNVSFYMVLTYGVMDKEICAMSDVKPLKNPCFGFILVLGGGALEEYAMVMKYLPSNIMEDTKAGREWVQLYNKVMKEREKKEARKAEQKRLREYK